MTQAAMAPADESVRDLQALAELLISNKTGLVKDILFYAREPDQFPMLYPVASLPDYSRLPSMSKIEPPGGSGLLPAECYARVLFETIERYAGGYLDEDRIYQGRALDESFLTSDRLPLYADFQYQSPDWPFRRLTPESSIRWTPGHSLKTMTPVFIPAVLVHVPYVCAGPDEWLGPSVSTGMAAHWSWEAACLAGLLEVCERDAFAIMWMNRLSMPRIRVENCLLASTVEKFTRHTGAKITFVNLTNDLGIPTALCVMEHRALDRPLITVGAAAKPDLLKACEKALAEAANSHARLTSDLEDMGRAGVQWRASPDFRNVRDWDSHALAYTDPELQDRLAFLTASEKERPAPAQRGEDMLSEKDLLALYMGHVEEKFRDILAVDLTPPDIRALGVHVAKILIPDAVPMHPDHRFPHLGHKRLYEVPYLLKYSPHPTTPDSLNRNPHPFA